MGLRSLAHLIFLVAPSYAFAPAHVNGFPRVGTELYDNTKQPPAIPSPKSITYGEESRKYRRTVYSHDDWVKHRSPDRFIRNILTSTSSGVYKNVGREIVWTVGIACFIFGWNMLAGGYQDLDGVQHDALLSGPFVTKVSLPLTPFTLASPSLGLLLGE